MNVAFCLEIQELYRLLSCLAEGFEVFGGPPDVLGWPPEDGEVDPNGPVNPNSRVRGAGEEEG